MLEEALSSFWPCLKFHEFFFSVQIVGYLVLVDSQALQTDWHDKCASAFESAIAIKTGNLVSLAPQQLVSCQPSYGTCSGGYFAFGFYKNIGANHEVDFPYQAANVACKTSAARHEWKQRVESVPKILI